MHSLVTLFIGVSACWLSTHLGAPACDAVLPPPWGPCYCSAGLSLFCCLPWSCCWPLLYCFLPFRLVCFCHSSCPPLFWSTLTTSLGYLLPHPSSLLSFYPAIVVLPYPWHSLGANNCPRRCAGWPFMHSCLCCVVINMKHFARRLMCINWHVLVSTSSMRSLQSYCYCMLPLPNP